MSGLSSRGSQHWPHGENRITEATGIEILETSSRSQKHVAEHAWTSNGIPVSEYFGHSTDISTQGSVRTWETRLNAPKCSEMKPERMTHPLKIWRAPQLGETLQRCPKHYGKPRVWSRSNRWTVLLTSQPLIRLPDRDVQQVRYI